MGIAPSVGRKGDSCDNALAESINGLYKTEVSSITEAPRGGGGAGSGTGGPAMTVLIQPSSSVGTDRLYAKAQRWGERLSTSDRAGHAGLTRTNGCPRYRGEGGAQKRKRECFQGVLLLFLVLADMIMNETPDQLGVTRSYEKFDE